MLKISRLKTLMACILILGAASPVTAQVGPGLGRTDTASSYSTENYANVCTRTSNGRLSLRTGPGQQYKKVKEISNGNVVALVGGQYSSDGFYWWKVLHNGNQGWVRADFVCGDPQ